MVNNYYQFTRPFDLEILSKALWQITLRFLPHSFYRCCFRHRSDKPKRVKKQPFRTHRWATNLRIREIGIARSALTTSPLNSHPILPSPSFAAVVPLRRRVTAQKPF